MFSNRSANSLPRGAAFESADVPDDAYPDGRLALEAVRRLEVAAQQPDQPFFIAVGFVKPHLPFCAPKRYWDLYDRDDFELAPRQTPPEGAPPYAPQFGGELRQYSGVPDSGPIPEELQRTLIHGYHAAISYMDAQLGRVLDALDRLDLANSTIIVLWGDHGWHLGDHGIWCKHTNYEQATRIPILIVAPGITRPGSRTGALSETIDLYPTLSELAGLPLPAAPATLDGRSLVPLLKDPEAPFKYAIFHVYPRHPRNRGMLLGRAVRTERYRLVEWKSPGADLDTAELELYDYQEDPMETKNVAPSRPQVVADLRAILARLPEGLAQLIASSPGYHCVAACPTAEDALSRLPALKPHVVLMDIGLPRDVRHRLHPRTQTPPTRHPDHDAHGLRGP